MKSRGAAAGLVIVALGVGGVLGARVQADEPARVVEARQRFSEGAELVRRAQWAEALVAFEASAKLRPHLVTTYNIAACQRALGRYTMARKALRGALQPQSAEGGRLPDALREEASALLAETDCLLVRLRVTMRPEDAAVSVDGRPLEASADEPADGIPALVAGVAAPGPGATPSAARFLLVIDPGAHVLTLSRKGYMDIVVNRSFAPSTRSELVLELDRLPATLRIEANTAGTAVALDQVDVGSSPIALSRPAGTYQVVVRKRGFQPFRTSLTVKPGEEANVRVNLVVEKPSVVRKWWFWTAIGAAVTVAATGAYLGAKAAETPQLDGGGLGWVVKAR